MQQRRALLLLALFAAPAVATSVSASSTAASWLQSHKSPTGDQLKELAGANPAAFAIVQALLSKHAKGQPILAPEDRGPDVFRRMMTPSHLAAARPRSNLPYASAELAEVNAPVIDQAHYNPNTAADRDESSVSRLLRAVASMGGNKGKKIQSLLNKRRQSSQEENPLTADASIFGEEPKAAPAATPVEVLAAAMPEPQEQAAPAKHENSYLKGIDLSGDMPKEQGAKSPKFDLDDTSSSLTSFSFGGDAPAAPQKPKPVVAPAPKKDNAFLKYLGFVNKAPAPEDKAPVAAAAPAQRQSSYLVNLLG